MLRTVILSVLLTVSVHPLLSLVTADSGEIFVHELPPEWHAWKEEHGKTYQSTNEEMWRHDVWKTNMEMIRTHNAEKEVHGYTLRMNHLGDLVRIIEPLKGITANEFSLSLSCSLSSSSSFPRRQMKNTEISTVALKIHLDLSAQKITTLPPQEEEGTLRMVEHAHTNLPSMHHYTYRTSWTGIPKGLSLPSRDRCGD